MNLIASLTGKKVTVFSLQGQTERQDVGILEAAEDGWLRVRKADGETLFFVAHNIRMIKPFEPL